MLYLRYTVPFLVSALSLLSGFYFPPGSLADKGAAAHGEDQKSISHRPEHAGRVLFRANGCFDCHSINGEGCTDGISLSSVGLRRDRAFLAGQLRDPEQHVNKNKKAFNQDPNLMSDPNLSPKETDAIVAYLQTLRKPLAQKR